MFFLDVSDGRSFSSESVQTCRRKTKSESHLMYPLYVLKLYIYRLKLYLIPSRKQQMGHTCCKTRLWIPPKWSPPFFYWAWEAAAESEYSELLLPKHLGRRCRYTVCGKPHPDLTLCTKRKRIILCIVANHFFFSMQLSHLQILFSRYVMPNIEMFGF